MTIKKGSIGKEEPKKKLFTKEELKDTVDLINTLKKQITEKRNQLNTLTKQNDIKINKLLSQNKQIELDYKEAEKMNKMLIFKRNELKRNIKNITVNGVNNIAKNKYKLNINKKENKSSGQKTGISKPLKKVKIILTARVPLTLLQKVYSFTFL